jgi:DNA-binding response OmpR family regulator
MARILVVEDEPSIRQWLHAFLSQNGHDVSVAANPYEALAMCCNGRPCFDLVVSDVGLPLMDGHELTRRIAAHCPTTRVLHMSGSDPACDDCPYTERCLLLKKPFRAPEVASVVETMLARPPQHHATPP